MNFLGLLENHPIFKDRLYKATIPMIPLAVAWVISFGFIGGESFSFVSNPIAFTIAAMFLHVAMIAIPYLIAWWVLTYWSIHAATTKRNAQSVFLSYNLIGFTLISLGVLGAAMGASALFGLPGNVETTGPALQSFGKINFLWFVAAFLLGREFLQMLVIETPKTE